MSWLPYLVLFIAGSIFGLLCHPLVRMLDSTGINHLLDALGRIVAAPFSLLGRIFRKQRDYSMAMDGIKLPTEQVVDPREQQLSDSAQTIRNLLLSLTSVIQRTDKAANDSSQTLDDVRSNIDRMDLPDDLQAVHTLLIQEIDRIISGNTVLKRELASSREILAAQREQIESLRTAVRIDGMTQLANRAYFDEKLAEMISLQARYNEPFSLLMIDVDNFKEINDSFGHQGGDRILKGVAFKVKSGLRESDFVARFGGDEFAVILIKAGVKAATDVAWKVCNDLRESRFLLDGHEVRTTLSIGVAEALPGETAERLLKRADEALYRVKEVGRNNVHVAEPPEAIAPAEVYRG